MTASHQRTAKCSECSIALGASRHRARQHPRIVDLRRTLLSTRACHRCAAAQSRNDAIAGHSRRHAASWLVRVHPSTMRCDARCIASPCWCGMRHCVDARSGIAASAQDSTRVSSARRTAQPPCHAAHPPHAIDTTRDEHSASASEHTHPRVRPPQRACNTHRGL
jgi:hypothetical protein